MANLVWTSTSILLHTHKHTHTCDDLYGGFRIRIRCAGRTVVNLAVVYRPKSLIRMFVSRKLEIDSILVEEVLESCESAARSQAEVTFHLILRGLLNLS